MHFTFVQVIFNNINII